MGGLRHAERGYSRTTRAARVDRVLRRENHIVTPTRLTLRPRNLYNLILLGKCPRSDHGGMMTGYETVHR